MTIVALVGVIAYQVTPLPWLKLTDLLFFLFPVLAVQALAWRLETPAEVRAFLLPLWANTLGGLIALYDPNLAPLAIVASVFLLSAVLALSVTDGFYSFVVRLIFAWSILTAFTYLDHSGWLWPNAFFSANQILRQLEQFRLLIGAVICAVLFFYAVIVAAMKTTWPSGVSIPRLFGDYDENNAQYTVLTPLLDFASWICTVLYVVAGLAALFAVNLAAEAVRFFYALISSIKARIWRSIQMLAIGLLLAVFWKNNFALSKMVFAYLSPMARDPASVGNVASWAPGIQIVIHVIGGAVLWGLIGVVAFANVSGSRRQFQIVCGQSLFSIWVGAWVGTLILHLLAATSLFQLNAYTIFGPLFVFSFTLFLLLLAGTWLFTRHRKQQWAALTARSYSSP